jgi:putative ABC transport system permease protein
VKNNALAESTAEEMRLIMRQRHGITDVEKDDFAITTMNEALDIINTIFRAITYLLVALAAISLLVGGVGIMNVMYVSVAERTPEIGLRKAVGAAHHHILLQFLVEAVVVTLIGGFLGILSGIVLSYGVSVGINTFTDLTWEFSISIFGIVLSLLFSTAIGLFFGVSPAKKAASMDPIVALTK